MTTRRSFLQTLAVLPPAATLSAGWAAQPDPSRIALVIGNNAYVDSPLRNPVNDARAMDGLFRQAGFTVDVGVDLKRDEMMAAMERFVAAIHKPETKEVAFYYAGHAVQVDWRNFLQPVDAVADSVDQVKQRCIDLGVLLDRLSSANGRTFIIILDACRDNPFGRRYRPPQQGLSQFDAPVGSLIAYATAPGKQASDGGGKNGLYTENLVRELAVRNARIEDALKRVRLSVRVATRGLQVPWESTSLESDYFLFADGRKKLSDAEIEKQLEADMAAWSGIQKSRKVEDWVAYLRDFPTGRFAEIAQIRLARLLSTPEAPAASSAPPPAPAETARAETPVPVIRNDADYDALPKGTIYRDPNGKLRRKS